MQVKVNITDVVSVLIKYLRVLKDRQVSLDDLVINKRLSKNALD